MNDETGHLLFHAGGVALATPASSVHCIHEDLPVQAVEGTCDWFLGLAVADGQLLPVTDLGAYINNTPATGRTLQVNRDMGIAGLRVDAVNGFTDMTPQALDVASVPGDETSTADEGLFTVYTISRDDDCYQVFDLAQLLQSSRFMDVGIP